MKLIVNGQQADWASKDLTVSGSDGIYLMEIELNDVEGLPSWESLTAYAVFKSSAMLAAYPDGIAVPINGGRAEIPAAILSEPGMLYVGVYGTNGSIVMPTIWAPAFCIALGCTEGSAPGPSVLDAARQAIKYGENAEVYAEGGYLVTDVQGPIEDPTLIREDTYTTGASVYADAAAASATAAEGSKDAAALSEQAAAASASSASDSKDAAALSAGAAASSATDAGNAKTAAETARDASVAAKNDAVDAKNAAAASATAAGNSETAAGNSATAAYNSETAAAASASAAALSATAAGNSETAAGNSANAAAGSAGAANDSAIAAAASAAEAAQTAASIAADFAYLTAPDNISQVGLYQDRDATPGAIVTFADGAAVPAKSATIGIEPVQAGSGDPSPTNVRPITGHTAAAINVNGVNQWDEKWESGLYHPVTGAKTENANCIRCENLIRVQPSTTYYIVANKNLVIGFWKDETTYQRNAVTNKNITFTTDADTNYISFYTEDTTYNHDISINDPATDHAYHASAGKTIPVDWTDEAGTVYGGTLAYLGGQKWRLTVDHKIKVFNGTEPTQSARPIENPNGGYNAWFVYSQCGMSDCKMVVGDSPKKSNRFAYTPRRESQQNSIPIWSFSGNVRASDGYISFAFDENYDTYEKIRAWFAENNTQVWYEIETPLVYDLTADELATLLGDNVIFADTGDIEDLTYRTSENSRTIVLGTSFSGVLEAIAGFIGVSE